MEAVDIFLRIAPIAVSIASVVVTVVIFRAGVRKAELESIRIEIAKVDDRVDKVSGELDDHKEAGQQSREIVAARLAQVEQTLNHLPDKEAVHKLDIAVTEIRGDLREQGATMRAAMDSLSALAASGQRIEDFLLRNAGR